MDDRDWGWLGGNAAHAPTEPVERVLWTTPAGKLQMHILAAIAEFERARIAERVKAGLARVRAAGQRLGRPVTRIAAADVVRTAHLSIREAAGLLSVSRSVLHRARMARSSTAQTGW